MRGGVPADLRNARLTLTTSAVINTNVVHALLAAPGLGKRYRLWSGGLSLLPNAAAGTALRGIFGMTTPATNYLDVLLGDSARSKDFVIPGGMSLINNAEMKVLSTCTVVSVVFGAWVFYTLEDTP